MWRALCFKYKYKYTYHYYMYNFLCVEMLCNKSHSFRVIFLCFPHSILQALGQLWSVTGCEYSSGLFDVRFFSFSSKMSVVEKLWTKFKVFATIIKDEKRRICIRNPHKIYKWNNERSKRGFFFNMKWACQCNDKMLVRSSSTTVAVRCVCAVWENRLFRLLQTPFQNAISIIVLVFCVMYTWFLVRLDKQTRALTHARTHAHIHHWNDGDEILD